MLTVLFNVAIPDNASMIMELILKMCSLEFIDTGFLQEYAFNFRETDSFGAKTDASGVSYSKFEDAGYETSIYFELLGPMLLIILVFSLIVLMRCLLKMCCRKASPTNCCRKRVFKNPNYLVVITRFLLESCIEIGLSAMICVLHLNEDSYENYWEIVSTGFAFISLFVLVVFPCYLNKLSKRFLEEAKIAGDPKESPYYPLFEDYNARKEALIYVIVFFLRRYALILGMTLLPTYRL